MPSGTEVKENIFLFVPNLIGEWTNKQNQQQQFAIEFIFIRIPCVSNDVCVVIAP